MDENVINFDKQAEILAGLAELRPKIGSSLVNNSTYPSIISALEQFTEVVRYLNTRRSTGTKLNLENEADVQDAVYLMLRPWVTDLIHEAPTSKTGNRFAIKDFLTKSAKTIIEAKFIRDKDHGKNISKEIHDDIEMYRLHPDCDHLIFFIYDPNSFIPNVSALNEELIVSRIYNGRHFYCHLIVRP